VVSRAAAAGSKQGIATALGVVTGLSVHSMLAIAGFAGLIASLSTAMTVALLAGAAVLFWLGWGLARNWRLAGPANHAADGDRRGYFAGFASNVSNPKALLFFSAVIPQFLGPGPDVGARTGVLAATVVFGAAAWWGLVISGIRLMPGLRSARAQSALALVGGLLLIGLSAGMLLAVVHEQLPG
jgi:threonine/homoserine/homoserine lactone efflux protein